MKNTTEKIMLKFKKEADALNESVFQSKATLLQRKQIYKSVQRLLNFNQNLKNLYEGNDRRSELLRFFLWFRENGEKYIDMSIERMIDIYLGKKS
jgi:hypothetical protein